MTRSLRRSGGVITLAELRRLGFTEHEVAGLIDHGELRRLHRAVYGDARAPLADRVLLKAALLAVRGECWLSAHSAAAGWGLASPSLVNIEVTVVSSCTPRHRGLRIRRASHPPHPSEVVIRDGLRISSVPRLLLEVAAGGATQPKLGNLIEQALRRNLLDVHDLAETLQRHRREPGVPALRAACLDYLPHADRKSGLERAFDRWMVKHPELPPPQRNVRLGPWEIDCYWPAHMLVLELDGRPYHVLMQEIERDHRKDAWLQTRQTRILRVTDARFKRDKSGVHRDLTDMLALPGAHGLSMAA